MSSAAMMAKAVRVSADISVGFVLDFLSSVFYLMDFICFNFVLWDDE
jgi:hypothetical protein